MPAYKFCTDIIPISTISPIPIAILGVCFIPIPIPIHTNFFHTDTDTGYWYRYISARNGYRSNSTFVYHSLNQQIYQCWVNDDGTVYYSIPQSKSANVPVLIMSWQWLSTTVYRIINQSMYPCWFNDDDIVIKLVPSGQLGQAETFTHDLWPAILTGLAQYT